MKWGIIWNSCISLSFFLLNNKNKNNRINRNDGSMGMDETIDVSNKRGANRLIFIISLLETIINLVEASRVTTLRVRNRPVIVRCQTVNKIIRFQLKLQGTLDRAVTRNIRAVKFAYPRDTMNEKFSRVVDPLDDTYTGSSHRATTTL